MQSRLRGPQCGAAQTARAHARAHTPATNSAHPDSIIGGLGSAVSEVVCEGCPVPVVRVGVEDQYGHSGKVPPLLQMYGLTTENIVAKAEAAIALKK